MINKKNSRKFSSIVLTITLLLIPNNHSKDNSSVVQTITEVTDQTLQIWKQVNQIKQRGLQKQSQQMHPFIKMYGLKAPVPAKYFQECKITQSKQPHPVPISQCPAWQNVKSTEIMANIAQQHIDELERMIDTVKPDLQDAGRAMQGIRCLEDRKIDFQQAYQEKINQLTLLKDQFIEISRKDTQNLIDIKNQMKSDHELIFGSSSRGKDIKKKNNPVGSLLKKDLVCLNILGSSAITQFPQGLNGLREKLYPGLLAQQNFSQDRTKLIENINEEVREVKKYIDSRGITAHLAGGSYPSKLLRPFPSHMQKIMQDSTVQQKQKREAFFKQLNIKLENQKFFKNKDKLIKKKYIQEGHVEDCIFARNKDDLAPPINEVLRMITQQNVAQTKMPNSTNCTESNKDGTAALLYGCEIFQYMNGSTQPKYKQFQRFLSNLDQKYAGYKIGVEHSKLSKGDPKPSVKAYMDDIQGKCRRHFKNTISKPLNKKIDRMNSFIRKEKTYSTEVANKLLDRVINCDEQPLTEKDCNQKFLTMAGNKNFCLTQVDLCATKIKGCHNKVDRKISQLKIKIIDTASIYNKNVTNIITKQNANLNQLKKIFKSSGKILEKFIPGSFFKEIEEMIIPTPTKEQIFGVELIGGGKEDFLDEIVEKIQKMQRSMNEQESDASRKIDEYIGSEKQAINENKQRWESIRDACMQKRKQEQQAANEQRKKQSESKVKLKRFCNNYQGVIDAINEGHPSGICGEPAEDLIADVEEVDRYLSKHTTDNIIKIKLACNSYERTQGDEDESKEDYEDELYMICERHNFDGTIVIEELKDQIMKTIKDDSNMTTIVNNALETGAFDKEDEVEVRLEKAVEKLLKLKNKPNSAPVVADISAAQKNNILRLGHQNLPSGTPNFCQDFINKKALENKDCASCTKEIIQEQARGDKFKKYNNIFYFIDQLAGIGQESFQLGQLNSGSCVKAVRTRSANLSLFKEAAQNANDFYDDTFEQ